MQEYILRLCKELERQQLWNKESRLLLAVSGGADSMALLGLVQQLPSEWQPQFAVVHVHHHLREESDEEFRMVQDYCQNKGIPFFSEHWSEESHPRSSLEMAAREFRYAFFADMMEKWSATHLATAHHADDQLETILMRLVRGSTLKGISGISMTRTFGSGQLVRPLLAFQKDELYQICGIAGIPYREDSTNSELTFTRNRYRNSIIPLLKAENNQASKHFSDFSEDLQDVLTVVQPLVVQSFRSLFTKVEADWVLDLVAWQMCDGSLQRLVLSHFVTEQLIPAGQDFRRSQLTAIMHLIENQSPQKQISLAGGWQARKRYDKLTFLSPDSVRIDFSDFCEVLELNKWVTLPSHGRIGLFHNDNAVSKELLLEALSVGITEESALLPFRVRSRHSGDKIVLNKNQPFTKKVSRLFVDKKIPDEERRKACIVTDDEGRILWVPGYAQSVWLSENDSEQTRYRLIYIK
ncbi:tRNA lysidine(34) synthetase TilS [Trichococcus collinsii]|uniref:tRNA(Ile)-lysidine synthase n=1 Tax=Trichococcus collinsii TaxID=157076 RepID=A0AB37ZZ15_9LACT|nr:tRNA lysidine(34) synthetase TilS [Trichococcus collinsii]CZR07724.1 phenylalanyl-trna synthetase b3/b4 [Trichococcus collinsii]SEA25726.1 tRNA(Ile)-lysidine synthase [Trichococcus collinsii]